MSRSVKIWLTVASALVLTGVIIIGSVMTVFNWDFSKLSTSKFETNLHETSEVFTDISVNTDTADIAFLPSEDGKCWVECFENVKANHAVTVSDGTLFMNLENKRNWYDYIMNFNSAKISVYLPKAEYGTLSVKNSTGKVTVPEDFNFSSADIVVSTGNVSFSASASGLVNIKTTTGKIEVQNLTAGSMSLTSSTGRMSLTDVKCDGDINIKVSTGKTLLSAVSCKNLTAGGSTGNISLTGVLVSDKLKVNRNTGSITLDGSDAKEISIKTDTGSVKGTLLSEKIFFVETDTGRISVPKTTCGGKCEIKTDTGNVIISIE